MTFGSAAAPPAGITPSSPRAGITPSVDRTTGGSRLLVARAPALPDAGRAVVAAEGGAATRPSRR